MPSVLPYVLAGAAAVLGVAVAAFLVIRSAGGKKDRRPAQRDRNAVIRAAKRRLAQDPRDIEANTDLAEMYYREENWAEAHRHYRLLLDLSASNPEMDEAGLTVRHALCALHLGKTEEAYKGLVIASTLDKGNFDVNFNLGVLEYNRKAYQHAGALLAAAQTARPDHLPTAKYLGLAEFRQKKYPNAAALLRKWLEAHPEDKECVAVQGQCYFYMKRFDLAGRIFSHLRPDPEHGPLACLYSATIRLYERSYDAAIADLEIGLRHPTLPQDLGLEMRYRLASAHLRMNRVDRATQAWREIVAINPAYRDAGQLLKSYEEVSSNRYLQTYLMGTSSEFVNLCRQLVMVSLEDQGTVKITDVAVHASEYADVLAAVTSRKWEETVLFRFLRSTGDVGDLLLRELNARLKDIRASRGVCFTAGKFNDGAKAYVEARLVDLREKEALLKQFQQLAARPTVSA